MTMRIIFAGLTALGLAACAPPPAEIVVSDGWTREIAPGQTAAAIYVTIANRGAGRDRLVTVEAARGEASLHSTTSADGVARMRPLDDGLEIAPRSTVALTPGGTHIMLTGLQQPLKRRAQIGMTLGFERSGKRPVAIRVLPASADGHGHGM